MPTFTDLCEYLALEHNSAIIIQAIFNWNVGIIWNFFTILLLFSQKRRSITMSAFTDLCEYLALEHNSTIIIQAILTET